MQTVAKAEIAGHIGFAVRTQYGWILGQIAPAEEIGLVDTSADTSAEHIACLAHTEDTAATAESSHPGRAAGWTQTGSASPLSPELSKNAHWHLLVDNSSLLHWRRNTRLGSEAGDREVGTGPCGKRATSRGFLLSLWRNCSI